MGKTRPGIERIHKQQMQAQLSDARINIASHMRDCGTCQRSDDDVYARCTIWWQYARQIYRARKTLRRYEFEDTSGMDPLFEVGG